MSINLRPDNKLPPTISPEANKRLSITFSKIDPILKAIKEGNEDFVLKQLTDDVLKLRGQEIFLSACEHRRGKVVECFMKFLKPSQITAYLSASGEEAAKIQAHFKSAFYLGHYNSIKNYNESSAQEQCYEMGKMLEMLPDVFSSHITLDEKERLSEGFKSASLKSTNSKELLSSIQKGELVILPRGYKGHSIHIVFCNGYMAILNKGDGTPNSGAKLPAFLRHLFGSYETIKAYKIDPSELTEERLINLCKAAEKKRESALKYYYETLPELLSPRADKKPVQDQVCKQLEKLRPKVQKIGNCAATQAKLSMRVGKAMINIKKDEKGNPVLAASDVHRAYAFSKDFSSHVRLHTMDRYLSDHLVEDETSIDKGLLVQTYTKLKKRFKRFPELSFYPNFKKWKEKLDAFLDEELDAKINKMSLQLYT